MDAREFEFRPPPEAPTFYPTIEEFQDPLGFIAKIRPKAEKYGICKVKPPAGWQPPFAVDVDNCKFTPRIQRLNELEAQTRIKLNFLDKIARFWELQGSSLKIPVVDKKALDLYTLHNLVMIEGGADVVSKERKWTQIAHRMGYRNPNHKGVGGILKMHYERVVHPYEVFRQGKKGRKFSIENGKIKLEEEKEVNRDKDYVPHHIPSRMAVKPPPPSKRNRRNRLYKDPTQGGSSDMLEPDPLEKYICHICARGDAEESMLLCDGCDDSYHTFCLLPPLSEIPKGDWRCPCCVAEEVSKPTEAFGFEQATQEYTLQQFGEMADQFKADYFNMPVHLVPTRVVEKEFWRIVTSIDEDVAVEYGADLHSMDHGSGFPTINSRNLLPGDEEYAISGWNLNNLPNLEGSVFGFINADISGMKVPWMYVGMCFAAFCWHTEDHWSYSINYMHWGEPKTWYGVPGSGAVKFEAAMTTAAPELFKAQPDLLHQLVTIMNPNTLMDAGVPVYRIDQHAGEFVITFPRAYHAGFNQGYNFAEAVNFTPSDWLELGRECVDHYSYLHRFCVFSHDELVCKIASSIANLNLDTASAAYQDMLKMVATEKELRKELLTWGVKDAEREAFELLPDDERQCDHCKTTCFLSALTCSCEENKLVCLRHKKLLCECSPEKHTLRYRYTMEELQGLLQKLQSKVESFNKWTSKLRASLNRSGEERIDLPALKELLADAQEKRLPDTELVSDLRQAVEAAEKCTAVAQQLISSKVRTRTRLQGEAKCRLSFEELQMFVQQLQQLPCQLAEAPAIYELLTNVTEFQAQAKELLEPQGDKAETIPELELLQKCLERGASYGIDLPEIGRLKQRIQQAEWIEKYQDLLGTDPIWDPESNVTNDQLDGSGSDLEEGDVSLNSLRELLELGVGLPPHPALEKALAKLQGLLDASEKFEDKAAGVLQSKTKITLSSAEAMVKEVKLLPTYLPSVISLKDGLRKAKDWMSKLETLQKLDYSPYLEALESLLNKAKPIAVKLEPYEDLEKQVTAAHSWRERTARTFLRKNSYYTLVEVLSPKLEPLATGRFRRRRLKEDPFNPSHVSHVIALGSDRKEDPRAIVEAFKESETEELAAFKRLRTLNVQKKVNDVQGQAGYCICQGKAQGSMIECCLCKEWFHTSCSPSLKPNSIKNAKNGAGSGSGSNNEASSNGTQQSIKDGRYLCGYCCRSRRPRLETILSLLVSLQKLPVRLPEGEALQCLTERAMNWQDRARQLLATEEVAACLSQLSTATQRLSDAVRKEKKIINASGGIADPAALSCSEESCSEEPMDLQPPALGNSEHAYSTSCQPSAKKNSRKSPLVPRSTAMLSGTVARSNGPALSLSSSIVARLEELLMEGDSLEVSLDETGHVGRILQAVKPPPEPPVMALLYSKDDDMDELPSGADSIKKKSAAKKRRLDTPTKNGATPNGKATNGKTSGISQPKKSKLQTKKSGQENKKRPAKGKDAEELCAAAKCRKPDGKEVHWVQCDGGCEMWFHLRCVGLQAKDVNKDEDYYCQRCSAKNPSTINVDDEDLQADV